MIYKALFCFDPPTQSAKCLDIAAVLCANVTAAMYGWCHYSTAQETPAPYVGLIIHVWQY